MSVQSTNAAWIAVDWGDVNRRAWAIGPDGEILADTRGSKDWGKLAVGQAEDALLDLIEDWLGSGPKPVLACGLDQGWHKVPRVAVPVKPVDLCAVRVDATRDERLALWIVPGLRQAMPADVTCGAETRIAGFLAREPGFDGVLCVIGRHTSWVHLSAGEIVSFQTSMTGEILDLLTQHSVLRPSVAAASLDPSAFADAVSDGLSRPERLAQRLFGIHADATLNGTGPQHARARLSGLLIAADLAAARPYWLGQDVVVVGAPALTGPYASALSLQGVTARPLDDGALTLAGLARIRMNGADKGQS